MGKDRRHRRSRSPSYSPERDKHRSSRERKRRRSRSRSPPPSSGRYSGGAGGGGRDRDRDRDRDRERRREKKRERKRSRSRDASDAKRVAAEAAARAAKAASIEPEPEEEEEEVVDKETEAQRLEMEMQKRRERIEKWRAEKRKKEIENAKNEAIEAAKDVVEGSVNPIVAAAKQRVNDAKMWNLEDDEDEEENGGAGGGDDGDDEEEEEDPLDAYMAGISKEVKKMKGPKGVVKSKSAAASSKATAAAAAVANGGADGKKKGGVVIMMGVAKKKEEPTKGPPRRGEIIEQNQDGLEYSSEGEKEENLDDHMKKIANKGKKDIAKIDHNKIEYIDFTKDFYREVPELAKMTDGEVEEYRQEMEGGAIKVKGKGVPKPIKSWPQCGVSAKILEILKRNGFEKPTPIQAQAIPVIMSGRDMMGIAKTGSGKTLAFLLPLFRHIAAQPELEEGDGPIAIILTPTRELCTQIGKEVRKFLRALKGVRCVCVYGGTTISEQIAELKRGAEIIVCTPGRMIEMLAANSGKVTNTHRVTYVVLDEADRMFDMGFEPQVMRIIDICRPDKQMVMFSATFPRQMEALARRILMKPVEVAVGGKSIVCADIEQNVHIVEEEQKFLKLLEVLGKLSVEGQVIIFVDKQEHADSLLKDLMNASYTSCASLHGGIDQYDRDSTITNFKKDKIKHLVATSICARGLDVKELVLVINYDCPNHYEDYVHRCGRTGRAGKKGFAHTFLTLEQGRLANDIIKALELSDALVPDELRKLWDDYKKEQEELGKKVKTGGGFGGTGFKFDESEATYTSEKKKFQKTVFGLQDSDDEDVEHQIDQQIEELMTSTRTVKTVTAAEAASTGLVTGANIAPGANIGGGQPNVASDKLEAAKRIAAKLNLKNNPKSVTQQATESYMSGRTGQPLITTKTVAEHLAAKLNAKLNYQPTDEAAAGPAVDTKETFQKYEEELVINDFPQQARWKVTSKEALAQISEYSDAGITVRGTYFPSGKEPPEGDRKLFLAIESTNELSVQKAKVEITRLLKEELMKIQTSGIQRINKGRYKVL